MFVRDDALRAAIARLSTSAETCWLRGQSELRSLEDFQADGGASASRKRRAPQSAASSSTAKPRKRLTERRKLIYSEATEAPHRQGFQWHEQEAATKAATVATLNLGLYNEKAVGGVRTRDRLMPCLQ